MQPIKLFLQSLLNTADESVLNYLSELIHQHRLDKLTNHLSEQQFVALTQHLNSKELIENNLLENKLKKIISNKKNNENQIALNEFSETTNTASTVDLDVSDLNFESKLKELVLKHQHIIVQGCTGTGKSTLIPLYLHNIFKKIVVTEPRRLATVSVSKRVSELLNDFELKSNLVGYKIRFEDRSHLLNKILFCTDGVLLKNFDLIEDCLIIDEAHERSLNIDLILSLFKYYKLKSKLIIMSATLNLQKIVNFFNVSLIINLVKKKCEVTTFYLRKSSINYLDEIYQVVVNLININKLDGWGIFEEIKQLVGNSANILVFLPGKEEIFYLKKKLQNFNVFLLHSEMKIEEMNLIYKNEQYKIILSTNIAETSITIKDLDVVIDSGLYNQMEFNGKLNQLITKNISKSMADQRKGRVGRTKDGIVFRMYTKEDFANFDEFNKPEILTSNLDSVVLKLLDLQIKIGTFNFIEEIEHKKLEKSIEKLSLMGLVNNGIISSTGRRVNNLPMDIPLARLMVEGVNQNISHEILMIISILGAGPVKITEFESKGDFFYFYKTFYQWRNSNFSILQLKNRNLNPKPFILAKNIYFQLLKYTKPSSHCKDLYYLIVKVFLTVFSKNVCKRIDRHFVNVYTGSIMYLHPNSVKLECQYVFYDDVIKTKRVYMQNVGELPYDIVKELGLE